MNLNGGFIGETFCHIQQIHACHVQIKLSHRLENISNSWNMAQHKCIWIISISYTYSYKDKLTYCNFIYDIQQYQIRQMAFSQQKRKHCKWW